jgi:hypothetical protein
MRHPHRSVGVGLVVAMTLAPRAGHAASDPESDDVAMRTMELGLGGAYLAAFDDETEVAHLGGVGGSWSKYFFRRLLSFEGVFHALFAEDVVSMPIDLVVKIDVELGRVVHPYATVGPTFIPEIEHGVAKLWVGAAVALGTDLWFSATSGFMIELNGNLVAHRGVRPEIGAFVGPVFRF